MPATRFLQGLVVQHAEPWVIVSKEREVVFATDAFTRTFSHQAVGIRCDSLFGVCAGSAPRGGCCWDHLEDYRRASRTPLWLLHQGVQPDVSVLCELHPVAMDGEELGVAIRLRPLRSRVGRLAEHVLGSLLGALDDPVSVRSQIAQDLARGYDLEVHWVDVPARYACASQAGGGTGEEVQAALNALLASGGESPFDI